LLSPLSLIFIGVNLGLVSSTSSFCLLLVGKVSILTLLLFFNFLGYLFFGLSLCLVLLGLSSGLDCDLLACCFSGTLYDG